MWARGNHSIFSAEDFHLRSCTPVSPGREGSGQREKRMVWGMVTGQNSCSRHMKRVASCLVASGEAQSSVNVMETQVWPQAISLSGRSCFSCSLSFKPQFTPPPSSVRCPLISCCVVASSVPDLSQHLPPGSSIGVRWWSSHH